MQKYSIYNTLKRCLKKYCEEYIYVHNMHEISRTLILYDFIFALSNSSTSLANINTIQRVGKTNNYKITQYRYPLCMLYYLTLSTNSFERLTFFSTKLFLLSISPLVLGLE